MAAIVHCTSACWMNSDDVRYLPRLLVQPYHASYTKIHDNMFLYFHVLVLVNMSLNLAISEYFGTLSSFSAKPCELCPAACAVPNTVEPFLICKCMDANTVATSVPQQVPAPQMRHMFATAVVQSFRMSLLLMRMGDSKNPCNGAM